MFKNFARAKEVHQHLTAFVAEMDKLRKEKKIEDIVGEQFSDLETYLREEIEGTHPLNHHKPHGIKVYDALKMMEIKRWLKRHSYLTRQDVDEDFRQHRVILTPVANSDGRLEFKICPQIIEVKYETYSGINKDFIVRFNKVLQVEEYLKECRISVEPRFFELAKQAKEFLAQI